MREDGIPRSPIQIPDSGSGDQYKVIVLESLTCRGNICLPPDVAPEIAEMRERLARLAGGLTITPTGLEVPSTGLTIPAAVGSHIYQPEYQEILLHSQPITGEKRDKGRSGSEIALATYDLPLFLSKEVRNRLGNDIQTHPYIEEVVKNIQGLLHVEPDNPHNPPAGQVKYSQEVLIRTKVQTGYYDRTQDKRVERTFTKPGTLEVAAIVMTDVLREPDFRGRLGEEVSVCLARLINNYRTQTRSGLELPEMPDLVRSIVEAIPTLSTRKEGRFQLYDALSYMRISPTLAAEIIEQMDRYRDLDHPLAYQLTLAIAEANPTHSWIRVQEERRAGLLAQLNGPHEELFYRYRELLIQSQGLVFAGDIVHPLQGKVGMELEYGTIPAFLADKDTLDSGWIEGKDWVNDEMRRSYDALEYDNRYRKSLVNLSKWLHDITTHLSSLHIHFDRIRHPHRPDIGNLYKTEGGIETLRENREYFTWEVRAMLPPVARGRLLPARVSDVVELYLRITTEGEVKTAPAIAVSEGDRPSIDQLIFGHIASRTSSPEARLALLMVMHTPFTMLGVNPFAFASTYTRESIPAIMAAAKTAHIDGGNRSPFLQLLAIAYETNFDGTSIGIHQGPDHLRRLAFVRRVLDSDDPTFFANHIRVMYILAGIHQRLDMGQDLTLSDLYFLYGVDQTFIPTQRQQDHIDAILRGRDADRDMAVIFGCSPDQIAHTANDISEDTKAYVGPLEPDIFRKLPTEVTHIYTSYPEGRIQRECITIGNKTNEQLWDELRQRGIRLSPYVEDMFKSPNFATQEAIKDIELIRLRVKDLGIPGDFPTTEQIYTHIKGLGLELCPAEVGPYYRLQYINQPEDEELYIAMQPITCRRGIPYIFGVYNSMGGKWLYGDKIYPTSEWGEDTNMLFSLCK